MRKQYKEKVRSNIFEFLVINNIFLSQTYILCQIVHLKGQSHEIFDPYFCFENSTWPHINKLKRFCELFRFQENIWLQSSKFACPGQVTSHPNIIFSKYCYWIYVNTLNSNYFFRLIVPLITVRTLQNLPSVFSQRLRRHAIFKNIKLNFLLPSSLFFLFFKN